MAKANYLVLESVAPKKTDTSGATSSTAGKDTRPEWREVGTYDATSYLSAIELAAAAHEDVGVLVAIPSLDWRPKKVVSVVARNFRLETP